MKKNILIRINQFYKNLFIKYKLLLVLYILVIIPLVFIGYISYKTSAKVIRNRSIMYTQDMLQTIELRLNDYFNNVSVLSRDLVFNLYTQNSEKIYKVLNDSAKNGSMKDKNHVEYFIQYNQIKNILQKILYSRSEIQSIYYISNTRDLYSSDSNRIKADLEDVLPYEEILAKARQEKGWPVWYVEYNNDRAENIYLARIINNFEEYKEMGLMVISVNKKFFETVYEGMLTEAMQNIVIISEDNKVIVSRNENITHFLDNSVLKKLNKKKQQGNRSYFIDKKSGLLVSYICLEQPKWTVVVPISTKVLYKEINVVKRWIFIFSFVTIIITSVLSMCIAIDFTKPIQRIVHGMEKLQKGEAHSNIKVDRNDELGFLSTTFNKMSAKIDYLVRWIYREQITRKEAELKALQSQINPHFLFNTLESINWMAQLNGVPEISETVMSLSALMELSIGRDDKLITIEQEVTYINHYINILKKRFEDKIMFVKNVDKNVLAAKIPRLLIQPLIENAAYHGIERSRKSGTIYLNVLKVNDDVVIEVIDNGRGITVQKLDKLNKILSQDTNTYFKDIDKEKSNGIGLENVNKRIKLFYGGQYGLKIESEYNKYTKVIIVIPLKYE